ncbi:MAG: GIY-YIG nuclease family protein [Candidatus Diapherotrites archaeon]
MPYFVYLLECGGGSFYCGYTSDLTARVKEHSNGRGGKYTRSHRPVKLVYSEKMETRSKAMQREREIKKFSRKEKENLIEKGKKEKGKVP